MAFVSTHHRSNWLDLLAAPFRALGRFAVLLAEASARSEAARVLSRMSDEELAARGTTRDAEIRRIAGIAG